MQDASPRQEAAAKERSSFYALYGGLFFLGILLGIVFVFAAVLIMYYKQVSEGYEDQSRLKSATNRNMDGIIVITASPSSTNSTVFFTVNGSWFEMEIFSSFPLFPRLRRRGFGKFFHRC